jgi:hypothetical protein
MPPPSLTICYSSSRRTSWARLGYSNCHKLALHSRSREGTISLLICVCANGTTLPPALIYKGVLDDLQNTWIEDLDERDRAYFTASTNGWTCNELGLAWQKASSTFYRNPINRLKHSSTCQILSFAPKKALLKRAVLQLATKFDIQSFENRGLRIG